MLPMMALEHQPMCLVKMSPMPMYGKPTTVSEKKIGTLTMTTMMIPGATTRTATDKNRLLKEELKDPDRQVPIDVHLGGKNQGPKKSVNEIGFGAR